MEVDTLLQNLTELHLHLGASSSARFLWELAHEQGIRVPEKDYWKFLDLVTVKHKTTSEKYLRRLDVPESQQVSPFAITQRIQSSPYAVEKCVHNAISSAYRKSSINKIEIRFNPMLRNRSGEHDLDKIILGACIGLKKACLEYPVKAGLILETDRQFGSDQHQIIARKAVAFKNMGVVGIDMSGPSPANFSLNDWEQAAQIAHTGGIGVTIHTGEVTDIQEMWDVVEKIKPHRIGHGIKAIQDKKLMKVLSDKKIVLELCPTSNVRTSVVKNWEEMGTIIKTLQQNNVLFTINSDGPVFLDTNVKKEFQVLLENKILTKEEVKTIISLARNTSFIK